MPEITSALIRNILGALGSVDFGDVDMDVLPLVDWKRFSNAPSERFPSLSDAQQDAIAALLNERVGKPAAGQDGDAIETYYARQIEWSRKAFGPSKRTGGVIDHIRKELREIEAMPDDLSEWIDVIILAMDGFWRHGGSPEMLMPKLLAKQQKNMARAWPDWRTMSENSAIEHDRSNTTDRKTPFRIWPMEAQMSSAHVEQPDFIYFACDECGFDSVQKTDFTGSDWCPLCASDNHDTRMSSRICRSTDKPEGKDARAALSDTDTKGGA